MKAGEVIIMAPTQGNAAALCDVLAKSGIVTSPCTSWDEFSARLAADPGAALFTEEVLVPQVMERLTSALLAQPPWSDLPIVILATTDGSGFESSPTLAALRRVGNITVLERPVRVLTLATALDSALRARARQHELKELLERERISREQAEYASRIRDDFLATVSHELRTPLSALLVWARLLATGKVSEKDFPRVVEDDGIGIPRQFLPHVFDRFRQADPSESSRHGGLGLGLAIVRQLVELHGGTVTAESAGKGKGATFTVVLPPAPGSSASIRRKKGRRPASRRLDHVRVMLVEDDDDMRAALSMLLESS